MEQIDLESPRVSEARPPGRDSDGNLPKTVRKRSGQFEPFAPERIETAIRKAGLASGEFGEMEARLLTAQVLKVLAHSRQSDPGIERIQDIVEQQLISANHIQTARLYIVYREQHHRLRQDKKTLLDVSHAVNEYLDRSDWPGICQR